METFEVIFSAPLPANPYAVLHRRPNTVFLADVGFGFGAGTGGAITRVGFFGMGVCLRPSSSSALRIAIALLARTIAALALRRMSIAI
jgi:hypothetical protein